ncbi:EpsG family protein [Epilithonimonas vandammei]|uniref:EpsG family protein n=1 Tax=Epilithonimonas vandammei TaxID=2487072 RepID=A0A3G8YED3_9FLAO|nr:EpsG family protein [Epilithonimonas vandammei]AZI39611.1 EpsG family protein [Epilithonimonas vandammei]
MIELLCFIFILFGTLFRRGKLLAFFFLVFLWICFGWSGENADTNIYLFRYKYYKDITSTTEPIFTYLVKISNSFDLNYYGFLIITSLFFIISLMILVKKLEVKYVLVPYVLFLIFPFVMSVVIVRFTLAAAFIIYGFSFLVDKKKYWWQIYTLCVIIASLIHSSSVFFILLLMVNNFSVKKIIRISIIFLLALLFISTLLKYVINADVLFLSEKMSEVNNEVENMEKTSFNYYFGTITRTLIPFCVFLFSYFKFYKKNITKYSAKTVNIIETTLKINLLFLSSIGLYFISVDFSRLLFPLLFLNYCVYALIMEKSKANMMLMLILLISCGLELYLLVLRYDFMVENVFEPFFNNRLFEDL